MQRPDIADDTSTALLVAAVVALAVAFSQLTYWTSPYVMTFVRLPDTAPGWWWPATWAAVFVAVVAVGLGIVAERLEREKKKLFRYLAEEALQRALMSLEIEKIRRQRLPPPPASETTVFRDSRA